MDSFGVQLQYPLGLDRSKVTPEEAERARRDPRTMRVAYGGAHFKPDAGGNMPVPTTAMFKRIKRMFPDTHVVDEYATSKMCPDCMGMLSEVRYQVGRQWRLLRGLRWCGTHTCRKFVSRDPAAARNILAADGPDGRPEYLSRDYDGNKGRLPWRTLTVAEQMRLRACARGNAPLRQVVEHMMTAVEQIEPRADARANTPLSQVIAHMMLRQRVALAQGLLTGSPGGDT